VEKRTNFDAVVSNAPPVFKLFAVENETLVVGWDPLLVLELDLEPFDGRVEVAD
jgi:hypothetical protein